MHITFAPRGLLQIDDATLVFKNFSGRADAYNRNGDKSFAIRIFDREDADRLVEDTNRDGVGWNVKIKPPREEGDDPFMYLNVKVKFNTRPPRVILITGDKKVELDEESIACLDNIEIDRVDLDISPYDRTVNGKPFRAAYLEKMYVTQRVDRFIERYEM
jgi:hypothetical protein